MIIEEKPGKNSGADWWANRVKKLLNDQKSSWQLLKNNYENLSKVQTRTFEIDGLQTKIQFNPARIKSSSADVSESGINSRECFLCIDKLPKQQTGLKYDKNFIILCNPYPIFEEHFTIINKKHKGQTLIGHFDDMLDLSWDLGKYYNVFYNGPKCGASAPDHMHFQAGTKKVTPLEQEIESLKHIDKLLKLKSSKIEVCFFENQKRNIIVMESNNKGELLYAFKIFVKSFRKISPPKEEPMMNLISSYDGNAWRIFIFPRAKHRPTQFYAEGSTQLLISPAAVDMAGLIITPRQEDFDKITEENVLDIYKQISLTKEYFEYLKKKLSEVF